MIGGIAAVILFVVVILSIPAWIHGIAEGDGKCDPGADCDSCPFPCENHNNKPSRK